MSRDICIEKQGLAEAFARKNGLDSAKVYEALSGGAAQNRSDFLSNGYQYYNS